MSNLNYFEEFGSEYRKFVRIEHPISKKPDVCAFLRLDSLFPDKGDDLISGSDHDIIYLNISLEEIDNNEKITKEDILYLVRCGVSINQEYGCLYMFT